MNVQDLITEWGAFYRAGGQNMRDLMVQLYRKSETDSVLTPINTEKTVLDRAYVTSTRVLQAFQKQFTAIGSTRFTPCEIKLHHQMIDVEEWPDDFDESWAAFLEENNLDRSQWPVIRWWLEKVVLAQRDEDYETLEVFKGVYQAPTPGTANPAGANMDGIRKKLNDGIAETGVNKITPLSTGAIETDPADFVKQVEDFYDQIPRPLKPKIKSLNMDHDLVKRFREGMRLLYNVNYAQVGDLTKIIDTDCRLVGLESMSGSPKIWGTVPGNGIVALKKAVNTNKFRVYPVDRMVRATTDYYKGVGFFILPWVVTNDQDTTDPDPGD